jgi:hypothetical protein
MATEVVLDIVSTTKMSVCVYIRILYSSKSVIINRSGVHVHIHTHTHTHTYTHATHKLTKKLTIIVCYLSSSLLIKKN